MNLREATMLERHILRVKSAWKPQACKIGNGEWVVRLVNGAMIWDAEDYENIVRRPVQQEEQVMV